MRPIAIAFLLASCTGDITADDPIVPPSTDVAVTVRDGNTPQAGVRVVFQAADGTLVADTTTDGYGLATQAMTAGTVTVIRQYPHDPASEDPPRPADVYTYVGVKAGDRLVVGNKTADHVMPAAIVVKVPDVQGTVHVMSSCGTGEGEAPYVALTVADCPAMIDFYVTTNNDQQAFYKRAAYAEMVDLASETPTGNLAASISATNVPPDTEVRAEEKVVVGAFELYSSGEHRIDQELATVDLPNITGVEQLVVERVDSDQGGQMIGRRNPYSLSPTIVDAGADLIPYVKDADFNPVGLSWTETGTGTADAVIASLDVTPASAGGEYRRMIIAPHTGTTLTIPHLPDGSYTPSTDDQIGLSYGIVAAPGGYDVIRASAFAVDNVVEIAPMGGKVTLSYGGSPPVR